MSDDLGGMTRDDERVLMITVWRSGAVDLHHEPNLSREEWLTALSHVGLAASQFGPRYPDFESARHPAHERDGAAAIGEECPSTAAQQLNSHPPGSSGAGG